MLLWPKEIFLKGPMRHSAHGPIPTLTSIYETNVNETIWIARRI